MNDILFILPSEDVEGVNRATQTPPLGVAYLSGALLKHQFSCKVIDMAIQKASVSEVLNIIVQENPSVVGISANLFTGRSGIKLAQEIRTRFGNKPNIVFGGAFPTSSPQKFLIEGRANAVVLGEGEATLLEIMRNLKNGETGVFRDIPGIAYLEANEIKINPQRELEEKLDNLPFPAWGLFPRLNLYKTRSRKFPVAPLLTSRGCPFSCVYCSKDVFKSVFRKRSPENVIEEIDYLVKEFNVRQIDIMDDNFSMDRNRAEKTLDYIIARNYDLAINLQLGVRADSVDESLLKKMRRAGVYKIAFGVESGDPGVLKTIKKQLDLEKVLKSTILAKKAGLIVYGFFMFGLPGDTPESMKKTIDFALKMDPDIANFVITIPFPGTPLYNLVKSKGRFLIDSTDGLNVGFYANRVFYELGDLKEKDVLYFYKLAYKKFYFRLSKILKIFSNVRSFSEVNWIINTAFSLIKPLAKITVLNK